MLLRDKVLELINKGVKQYEIAKVADKSSPTISRFVKGEPIEFSGALLIVKNYFPDEEIEIMADFRNHTHHMNERSALEYYIMSGNKISAKELIDELYKSDNRHDNEFARMYEIELFRLYDEIKPIEAIKHIETAYLETIEMKIYSSILKAYCYYELRCFDLAKNTIKEVEYKIPLIKNKFISVSYELRIGQALSTISLHESDVQACRNYNIQLMNNPLVSSLLASIHTTLGNSYIFEDAETAIMHLEEARSLYIESNRIKSQRVVENSINFIQNYYNIKPQYIELSDDVNDIHANAYFYIKSGEYEKAYELLNKVNIDQLSNFNKGFHYYYRGEITKDKNHYYDSILCFRLSGDRFYRQLPIKSLAKLDLVDEKLLHYLGI